MKQMKTSGYGAACLLGAGLGYLMTEAVTASAWKTPPYSYVFNYISDLGAPMHGMFFGHERETSQRALRWSKLSWPAGMQDTDHFLLLS